MKTENPYLKVLKKRYLSLIVIPVLIISLPIYYVNFQTIGLTLYHVMAELPIVILVVALSFKLLIQILRRAYIEAFAQVVRLFFVGITIMLWWHYLSTSVERTIERFEAKRDYYVREAIKRSSKFKEGDYPLVTFNLKPTGTVWRAIIYDKTDKYFDPNIIVDPSSPYVYDCDKIIKIEPHFYYSRHCYDYEITPDVTNIEE